MGGGGVNQWQTEVWQKASGHYVAFHPSFDFITQSFVKLWEAWWSLVCKMCTLPALEPYPANKAVLKLCALYAMYTENAAAYEKNKKNKKNITEAAHTYIFHSNSHKLTTLHISFMFEVSSASHWKTTTRGWLTMQMAWSEKEKGILVIHKAYPYL